MGAVADLMPVIATTAPIVGRKLTLPAGTRLVATHQLPDGRWACCWNGHLLVVRGVVVVAFGVGKE